MTDKKELNDEELEKATGGFPEYSGNLSDFVIETYDEPELGCFYIDSTVLSNSSNIAFVCKTLWMYSKVYSFHISDGSLTIPERGDIERFPLCYDNEILEFKQKYPYKLQKKLEWWEIL